MPDTWNSVWNWRLKNFKFRLSPWSGFVVGNDWCGWMQVEREELLSFWYLDDSASLSCCYSWGRNREAFWKSLQVYFPLFNCNPLFSGYSGLWLRFISMSSAFQITGGLRCAQDTSSGSWTSIKVQWFISSVEGRRCWSQSCSAATLQLLSGFWRNSTRWEESLGVCWFKRIQSCLPFASHELSSSHNVGRMLMAFLNLEFLKIV